MTYRETICGHCGLAPADGWCDTCALWICVACRAHGCAQTRSAWTGDCIRCGTAYADEQRRGVLDDGDGEVVCHRCGSRFRLRRLELVEADVAQALLAGEQPCACGNNVRTRQLFVLHDRWVGRTTSQNLYHLLCACGVTLASHASRPSRE